MHAAQAILSDIEIEARGTLLNVFIGGLEAMQLAPEERTVTQDGFTVLVRGRLIKVSFADCGHYLDIGGDEAESCL
jgi:hypothetical protein